MDYSTIERNEVKEKTMIWFGEKQIFSDIDPEEPSVYSETTNIFTTKARFDSITTSDSESQNSESTAASVYTPFSGISDCLSTDFSIGLTIRSDYSPKEFFGRLAPNKKCSKVEDLNEYYKQFERTRSPGAEEWSEDSSDSDDSFDFFGFRKSTKGLTKEETEEHSIPEYVESEKETKSDTKINTSSDSDSDSNLFAINWTYEPSFDEHWIPENYLPNIPKRQTNKGNEMNAKDFDCDPYVVDSADLMKSHEVQENRDLNEELSEEKSENLVEIETTLIEKDSMEDQMTEPCSPSRTCPPNSCPPQGSCYRPASQSGRQSMRPPNFDFLDDYPIPPQKAPMKTQYEQKAEIYREECRRKGIPCVTRIFHVGSGKTEVLDDEYRPSQPSAPIGRPSGRSWAQR